MYACIPFHPSGTGMAREWTACNSTLARLTTHACCCDLCSNWRFYLVRQYVRCVMCACVFVCSSIPLLLFPCLRPRNSCCITGLEDYAKLLHDVVGAHPETLKATQYVASPMKKGYVQGRVNTRCTARLIRGSMWTLPGASRCAWVSGWGC